VNKDNNGVNGKTTQPFHHCMSKSNLKWPENMMIVGF